MARSGSAAKPSRINAVWHRAHRLPARTTTAERLKWHLAHGRACGCRPMPASLRALAAVSGPKGANPKAAKTKAAKTKGAPAAEAKRARTRAPGVAAIHARLREICLSLPQTTEVEAWGHPTFRVAGKIFVGFSGTDEGGASLGVKTTHELQAALVSSDPRFTIAAYVGKHGWISLAIPPGARIDWNEIEVLVHGSYRLVAPARLAATVPAP